MTLKTKEKSKVSKPKKSKETKFESEAATAKVVQAGPEVQAQVRVRVKQEDFIRRLTEKLTHFDANMILDAAMLSAGVERQEGFFKKDEAKEICLALIKRGGPAYAVGAGIYREVVG